MAQRRHRDRVGLGPGGQGSAFNRRGAVGSGSQETTGNSEESGQDESQAAGEGGDRGLKGHFICR